MNLNAYKLLPHTISHHKLEARYIRAADLNIFKKIFVLSFLGFVLSVTGPAKSQSYDLYMPSQDLLGAVSYTTNQHGASDPSNWQNFSYIFTPIQTGNNYVGIALRQDPAYWTVGNFSLLENGTGTNLLINPTLSYAGNGLGFGGYAPGGWGVWYQNGVIPNAAGLWLAPGSINAATDGISVNTSTNGSWVDGAVGSYDGLYQSLVLSNASNYTFSFTLYGDNSSNTALDGSGSVGLGAYSGACSAGAIGLCTPINSSFGILSLVAPNIISANNGLPNYNSVSTLSSGNYSPRFDGGTLLVDVAGTYATNFTITPQSGFIDQNGLSATFSGVISNDITGGGNLTFTNTGVGGVITLTGVNTYTGNTNINSGATVALLDGGSIATSRVVGVDGVFDISQAGGLSSSIRSLNDGPIGGVGLVSLGSKVLYIGASEDITQGTYTGVIADGGIAGGTGGSIWITGDGFSQTLGGINTYTGSTTIDYGSALNIYGTTASISSSSNIVNNGTLTFSNNTSTYDNVISGIGNLSAIGGSTLTLTNQNTYIGSTSVDAVSTLILSGNGSIGSSSSLNLSGVLDISQTTSPITGIQALNDGQSAGSGVINLGANTLIIGNTGGLSSGSYSGVINDGGIAGGTGGGLKVTGLNYTQTLGGLNTYTGSTTIDAGATLALAGAGSISNSSNVVNNGTLDISQAVGGVRVQVRDLYYGPYAGVMTGISSPLNWQSAGYFLSSNNFTGPAFIAFTNPLNGIIIYDIAIVPDDQFILNGPGGMDSNIGTACIAAANTVCLPMGATQSLYSAVNTLNGGMGIFPGDGYSDILVSFNSLGINALNGSGAVNLGSGTLIIGNTGGLTSGLFSGVISDGGIGGGVGGSIQITGVGYTQTLSGVNTYTGVTGIDGGSTLALSGNGSIATSRVVYVDGVFDVSQISNPRTSIQALNDGLVPSVGLVNLGSSTLAIGNTGGLSTSTFSGVITDGGIAGGTGGSIEITGAGYTQILSGINTYTGSTTINSGATLVLSNSGSMGMSSVTNLDGVLDISQISNPGINIQALNDAGLGGGVLNAGDKILVIGNSGGITNGVFSGVIADGGINSSAGASVEITGTGYTQTFSGINTYTGSTTIDTDATLALSGGGSIATTSAIANNGTFDISAVTANVTLGSVVSNSSYTQASGATLKMGFSPANNQQLNITGTANLDGTLSLYATAGNYATGRYTLITATGGVFGTFSQFNTFAFPTNVSSSLLSYDDNDVYLNLIAGPSTADTQSSIQLSVNALQSIYSLQTSAIALGLTYDCNLFDKNGICVSNGGRYERVSTGTARETNALLIGGYKLNPNMRLGAWLDQNLSNNTGTGISLNNGGPMFGIYGVWNQDASSHGLELKVSAGYGDRNMTVTRQVIGTSEPGSGSTALNTLGVSGVASYNIPVSNMWTASPYLGLRYTKFGANAYSEQASAAVTAPLSYGALNQTATTALAGLKFTGRLTPQVGVLASAGLEQDLNNNSGIYSATGVSGLSAIAFNPTVKKTRGVVSAGAYYDLDKSQRVSLNAYFREEAFTAINTTTTMLMYTVGF